MQNAPLKVFIEGRFLNCHDDSAKNNGGKEQDVCSDFKQGVCWCEHVASGTCEMMKYNPSSQENCVISQKAFRCETIEKSEPGLSFVVTIATVESLDIHYKVMCSCTM